MSKGSGLIQETADTLSAIAKAKVGEVVKTEKGEITKGPGIYPKYSSGARSYIRVAGTPIAVCQSFSWRIVSETTEIKTIDTNLPWDISFNQIGITATLNELVDPRGSLESEGLFHTFQSFIHQPFVEMQVLDATGSSLFFARGSFCGMSGSIRTGQLSNFSVDFKGVAYQHNVFQSFRPYSLVGSALNTGLQAVNTAVQDLGGGFF
jgi:hypothetical protein